MKLTTKISLFFIVLPNKITIILAITSFTGSLQQMDQQQDGVVGWTSACCHFLFALFHIYIAAAIT